jgi:hypothetical protein
MLKSKEMKKLIFSAIISIIGFSTIQSQGISFGATGGLFYGSADISGVDISSFSNDLNVLDGAGFYVGLLADVEVIGDLHVQPELLYANIGGESSVFVPVMVKYYVAESFNLQIGPQLDFVLDVPSLVKDYINTFGLSMAIGAGLDLTEKISLQAKYSLGLNNRIDDKLTELLNDFGADFTPSLKTNILQAGVVYKF